MLSVTFLIKGTVFFHHFSFDNCFVKGKNNINTLVISFLKTLKCLFVFYSKKAPFRSMNGARIVF